MPHTTLLNDSLGVVLVRYRGRVELCELRDVLDEMVALPGFRAGLKHIADFRGAETPLTGDDIRRLADYAKETHHAFGATKWAIIASNTASYGLARMYSALTNEYEVTVQVFRDAKDADDWFELGIDLDQILALGGGQSDDGGVDPGG